jgi:hypothetical protein
MITPLPALRSKSFIKILVYAKYGVGKTTFAGTAVDVEGMRDVLVVSFEGGESVLFDNPMIRNHEMIDVLRVTSFKQLQSVRDFAFAHARYRDENNEEALRKLQLIVFGDNEIGNGRLRKYRTIIIDSLTEIEALNMQDLLGIHEGFNLTSDMPTAEFKEYKMNFNKMQMFIRIFRDLKMHIIMTASPQWDQDESKVYHYTLNLTGKLASQVQGFFDIVGFMQTGQATEQEAATRRLWIQPVGGKFDAKTRLAGCKKSFFDNPRMADIMKETGYLI